MEKIIFLLFFMHLMLVSCNRKGCLDELANNYDADAKKEDGSCTYNWEKFVGSYNVTTGPCDYDPMTYVANIIPGPNVDQMIVTNFHNRGIDMLVTINGNNFTFSSVSEGVGYVGDGYIIDNNVTVNSFLCEDYNYPDDCVDSSCQYSFVRL